MLEIGLHDVIPFDGGVHCLLLAIHDRDDDLSWLSTLTFLQFQHPLWGHIPRIPFIRLGHTKIVAQT